MIIREKQGILPMLFAWRGTIFPKVLPAIIALSGLSVLMGVMSHYHWFSIPAPPLVGFTIFGVVLSIFLGFRNNACYERWWEGRKLWGRLVATERHLIRDSRVLDTDRRRHLLKRSILFTCLLRDRLRYQTAHTDLFLEYGEGGADIYQNHPNPPQFVLEQMQRDLIAALRQEQIGEVVYSALTRHIEALGEIQAGCDRIASTPLPFAYSVLLHRAIYSFCIMLPFGIESVLGLWTPLMVAWLVYMFLGLDALSSQLGDPFGLQENNLPLDSLVRVIEREVLSALGQEIPPPLAAEHYVMT
jgi:hypothetical protein